MKLSGLASTLHALWEREMNYERMRQLQDEIIFLDDQIRDRERELSQLSAAAADAAQRDALADELREMKARREEMAAQLTRGLQGGF